jgi:hypothetical protein
MLSNVLTFTKAHILKRHYKVILHTDNKCKLDEKCRKYGQDFIYPHSKVRVSLQQFLKKSAASCTELHWILPRFDMEYWILQAEIHLPPRVKYNCCTDFQESHI